MKPLVLTILINSLQIFRYFKFLGALFFEGFLDWMSVLVWFFYFYCIFPVLNCSRVFFLKVL